MLYDGKYTEHVESLPLDGTADIISDCDCDNIERSCWWYLPLSLGLIVLAYAVGFISAVWSIAH